MNENNNDNQEKKVKKEKKTGIIRKGFVVPMAIVSLLVFVYFTLFLDSNLKSGIEWTLTKIYGAEVNIESVKTDVSEGTFKLKGLEFVDKDKTDQNLIKVKEIRFAFLWKALLQAKFVINEASINDILLFSPRKNKGQILVIDKNDPIEKITKEVTEQASKKQNSEMNPIQAIAKSVENPKKDTASQKLPEKIKSEEKVIAMDKELDKKEKDWQSRINNLVKTKELEVLVKKIKNVKIPSNPIKALKEIKKQKVLLDEVKQKISYYKSETSKIKNEINSYKEKFKILESMSLTDYKDLQSKLNLVGVDTVKITKGLFGEKNMKKLATVRKYLAIVKEYLPEKSNKPKEKIIPRKRGKGVNYNFSSGRGYPRFLLKLAKITSSSKNDNIYAGDLSGSIKNLTSNPVQIGKPATMVLKGNFPKSSISNLKGSIILNHHIPNTNEIIDFKVGKYPIFNQMLTKEKFLTLGFKKAMGQFHLRSETKDESVLIRINNKFKKVDYVIDSNSKMTKSIFSDALNNIQSVDMYANAKGTWSNLDWSIRSNLGKAIADSVKRKAMAKINEAKKKLQNEINKRINGPKKKLMSRFTSTQSRLNGIINKEKGKLDNIFKTALNNTKKKASSPIKKPLDNLKKKFKKIKFKF